MGVEPMQIDRWRPRHVRPVAKRRFSDRLRPPPRRARPRHATPVRMESESQQIKDRSLRAGTLSLLRNEAGRFILLRSMALARWSDDIGDSVSFALGWKVTAVEGGDAVRVQLGSGEGVCFARWGMRSQHHSCATHPRQDDVSIYINVAGAALWPSQPGSC
jgi:hypothetical protein